MKGELGIKVSHIKFDVETGRGYSDFSIYDEDGGFLHICGNNNWDELFTNALRKIDQEHIDELVECHFPTYEFEKDGDRTGHYARGIVQKKLEMNRYEIYFLHDGSTRSIHADWLMLVETNKYLSG